MQDLSGRIVRMLNEQFTQLAEVVLETTGSDDLDYPARLTAGIPHRVHLSTRFGDVAAGTQHHLAVVGAKADLARDHDRVLVLPSVLIRRSDRADRERMLDDRHFSPGVAAGQLEHSPESGQGHRVSLAGLHHCDADLIRIDHLTFLLIPTVTFLVGHCWPLPG